MSGDPQATSSRLTPTLRRAGPRWSLPFRRGPRRSKQEQLELIERVDRLERQARKSGPYIPELGPARRWS
jgi:hypothetical protein